MEIVQHFPLKHHQICVYWCFYVWASLYYILWLEVHINERDGSIRPSIFAYYIIHNVPVSKKLNNKIQKSYSKQVIFWIFSLHIIIIFSMMKYIHMPFITYVLFQGGLPTLNVTHVQGRKPAWLILNCQLPTNNVIN